MSGDRLRDGVAADPVGVVSHGEVIFGNFQNGKKLSANEP
jgi:hypothetical protein